MNDAHTLPFQRTATYRIAKALAAAVHRLPIADAELRDQASRASKSAFLQVAEGLPNFGVAMRRKYFVCARNSACEVAAAYDLAAELDMVGGAAADEVHALAAELLRLLGGLLR